MRDLTIESHKDNLNNNKIEIQRQVQSEYSLIGSILTNKSHILFEYNKETLEIKIAKYKIEKTAFITNVLKGHKEKRKVIVNKQCYYIQALNEKNAIKKLRKLGFEI